MAQTFKEAYGVLSGHAQALREQQEPNIDQLLNIVTESVAAYKVCKERIDAVETALMQALADPAVVSSMTTKNQAQNVSERLSGHQNLQDDPVVTKFGK
jgi:exodeoxyribonuclease VII small subunit